MDKNQKTCRKKDVVNSYKEYNTLKDWFKLRLSNKKNNSKKLNNVDYIILNDGAHDFGLDTFYIKTDSQTKFLRKMFNNISIYSINSGEIIDEDSIAISKDPWCYYFCSDNDKFFVK